MRSTKVYIAAPFRAISVRDGDVAGLAYGELRDQAKIGLLQDIEAAFLDHGWLTCLPHRDEGGWGATYYQPSAISALCLRHVETADLICAIPGRSRGVHIELGRASAFKVPVVAFRCKDEEASTLLPGVGRRAHATNRIPSPGELLEVVVDDYAQIPERVRTLLAASPRSTISNERRVGIVDLGSNSVKLSRYSVRQGRRPIPIGEPERESISIADGVRVDGRLSKKSLEQIRNVLHTYASLINDAGAEVIVVGTEALRQAANIAEVEAMVKAETGAELRLLSQQTEADAVADAIRNVLSTDDPVAALNLGASSVQIVGNLTSNEPTSYLMRFGTKDLTASFPWRQGMTSEEWNGAYKLAAEMVSSVTLSTGSEEGYMFHTGGELDFLLRCRLDMDTCHVSPTHVSMVSVEAFAEFAREFAARNPEDVMADTGLKANWLSGAVASNAIALASAHALRAAYIVPSNLNVADGLLQW